MPPKQSRRSAELQAEVAFGRRYRRWRCTVCGGVGQVERQRFEDGTENDARTLTLAGRALWLHQDTQCTPYADRFGGTTLAATQAATEADSANDAVA